MPEDFKRDYEEFVMNYEFPLVVAFQAFLTACFVAVLSFVSGVSALVFLICWLTLCLIAYVAYRASLPAALEMAEQQRTAFDLYRSRILELWPTVDDVVDEIEAFARIEQFVIGNAPPSWASAQARHRSRREPEPQTPAL